MMMTTRLWLAGAMFATVGGLVYVSGATSAQGEKDPAVAVKKIAAEIKKGNLEGAKKAAAAAGKDIEEVADLMHLYRPRNKGGLGWGAKAGTNPATDGLEKKIQEFAKGVPANIADQVENNVEAAYWIAALTEVVHAKTPAKDSGGGKTKKAWTGFTDDMRAAGNDLIKAAAAKDGKAMSKAANKINSACINCHSKFKE